MKDRSWPEPGLTNIAVFEAIKQFGKAGPLARSARVKLAALGAQRGELAVPQPDYFMPASFGSLELRPDADNEFIGQDIPYDAAACNAVPMVSLDSLGLNVVAVHAMDPTPNQITVKNGEPVVATS